METIICRDCKQEIEHLDESQSRCIKCQTLFRINITKEEILHRARNGSLIHKMMYKQGPKPKWFIFKKIEYLDRAISQYELFNR